MKKTCIALVIILSVLVLTVAAKEYISFNGGFYITYPDSWAQIDYQTVDIFLSRNDADSTAYRYEAVLAAKAEKFFNDDYLIIRIDSIAHMSDRKRDSVLNYHSLMYESPVKYMAMDDIIKNIKPEIPYHDRATNSTVIYRPISIPDGKDKFNLIFFRFTDYGLVKFFFYSANDEFDTKKIEFSKIFNSFSTENIEAKLKGDEVKIADIDTKRESKKEKDTNFFFLPGIGGFFIIILIIIIARKRRKKQENI